MVTAKSSVRIVMGPERFERSTDINLVFTGKTTELGVFVDDLVQ
jgi:hypothetical protein